MTPTEQDKELRLEIARKVYPRPTPGEIMTWGTPEAVVEMYADSPIVYEFANLITADRKRVALEARLDERQMLSFHRAYGRDYQATLETLEEANDKRIAELKAQQEEVK